MELTTKQEQGLKIAVERYKHNEKYTVISGYAGTGKSTLVRFIIEALDVAHDRVCYATFTGKAAEVLRKKGNKNACTLHRLLYDHIPKPGGGFYRKMKTSLDYDIVVVDEVSMAPKEMMDLLFSHKVYVICLGDPFQIPPIDKNEDNHLLDNPHIFLDEIMRQAQESEIIRLSMDIRAMQPLELFKGTNLQVLSKIEARGEYFDSMLLWADQVLVATNVVRNNYNHYIRNLLGRNGGPVDGDKVVCRRNYWEDLSDNHDALVNGTIGYLKNPTDQTIKFPLFAHTSVPSVDGILADVVTDTGDIYPQLSIDKLMIVKEAQCLDWRDSYKLGKLKPRIGDLVPKQFVYGYAITGHKAQGSEWDKVLVLEENYPFEPVLHARWLYTCATRAADKLVIVRN